MAEGQSGKGGAGAKATPTVLIVDDDVRLLRALQILLEDEGGFDVLTAHSATEALRCAETTRPIDLVLCDLSLPDRDGISLIPDLRRRLGSAPVLLMSAHDRSAFREEARRHAAAGFLAKPLDPDELLAEIHAHVATFRENSSS